MTRTLVILAFLLTTAFAEFTSWPSQVTPLEGWDISYNGLNQRIVWIWSYKDGEHGIIERSEDAPDAPRLFVTLKYDQKQDFAFLYIRATNDDQWICAFRNDSKAPIVNGTLYHLVGGGDAKEVSGGCKVSLPFLGGGGQDFNWPPVLGALQLWKLEIGDEVNVVQATEKAQNSNLKGSFTGFTVLKTDSKTILGAILFPYDTGSKTVFVIRIARADGSNAQCTFDKPSADARSSLGGGTFLSGYLEVASEGSSEFKEVKDKKCTAQMISF
jgi:hypothetical protein